MPIYGFHLEVPAAPDEVSSRLRAAVGKAPTLWESLTSSWRARPLSGRPFIGRVESLSFRIRRDSRFRNPLQPRIAGGIVKTSGGSRLDAWLYIRPLSLLVLIAVLLLY
jgi:hypothetical protein